MFSEFSELEAKLASTPYSLLSVQREELIADLSKQPDADFVVVGGGIHGAAFARLAAFNGFKTVLLERADYASGTSSRSSKLAHGGLRYLELMDFRQVCEGVRAREDLFQSAPHLARPHEFFLPTFGAGWLDSLRYRLGLSIYDLFLRNKKQRFHVGSVPDALFEGARVKPTGGFIYVDGVMRDARLVMENIIAARQEGARCLNYARVDSIYHIDGGRVVVGWTDVLQDKKYELRCGVVINCCGPWAPVLGRIGASPLSTHVRYSQGAHLIFNKPWKHPALFLPLSARGQYYFVLPHFAGTLVGTTESEVQQLADDPVPLRQEVEELLRRVSQDIPGAGLDRQNLHYCFAGVRTLVSRGDKQHTADLSRRPIWSYANGVLTLLGGKYTTASVTAFEGLKQALRLSASDGAITPLGSRLLPGAANLTEVSNSFLSRCRELHIDEHLAAAVLGRFGSLVRYFLEREEYMLPIAGHALRGEVEFALDVEQAENLEDLMRRRLELELVPGHGVAALAEIVSVLGAKRPTLDLKQEQHAYQQRLGKLRELMG